MSLSLSLFSFKVLLTENDSKVLCLNLRSWTHEKINLKRQRTIFQLFYLTAFTKTWSTRVNQKTFEASLALRSSQNNVWLLIKIQVTQGYSLNFDLEKFFNVWRFHLLPGYEMQRKISNNVWKICVLSMWNS